LPKNNQKNRSARRGNKKRASGPTQSNVVPRADFSRLHISTVPQTQRQTLIWTYATELTYTTTYAENAFLMNSPYDPDTAFGGTQPTGFAKMMAFYSKCFCIANRIRVTAVNTTNGTIVAPIAFGVTVSTNSTSLGSVAGAISNGLTTYDLIGTFPDHRKFEQTIDVGKFLNKPKVLDDPQLFCTASANPSQIIVAHVWGQSMTPTTTSILALILESEYECIFTDPIPFS